MASDDADEVLAKLREATAGLLYMSESDEPFEVVSWPGGEAKTGGESDEKTVLKLTGHKPRTPIKQMTLEAFFEDLTQEQDWHGAEEKADVRKYRRLLELVRKYLADPKVYRLGTVQVEIYILGRTRAGAWAGVKTKAVET